MTHACVSTCQSGLLATPANPPLSLTRVFACCTCCGCGRLSAKAKQQGSRFVEASISTAATTAEGIKRLALGEPLQVGHSSLTRDAAGVRSWMHCAMALFPPGLQPSLTHALTHPCTHSLIQPPTLACGLSLHPHTNTQALCRSECAVHPCPQLVLAACTALVAGGGITTERIFKHNPPPELVDRLAAAAGGLLGEYVWCWLG